MSMFYTYEQNNSGGRFATDEKAGIGTTVIVEAISAMHANTRAVNIGLYFNGCDEGIDCNCCGDRWSVAYEDEGSAIPSTYGTSVYEAFKGSYREDCYIHRLDGTIEHVQFKPKP